MRICRCARLALGSFLLVVGAARVQAAPGLSVFVDEFHYDNAGTDTGEFVEVFGPAGTDLTGWQVILYNGNGGASYDTKTLSGTIPQQVANSGVMLITYPANGIQNGSPDGIALVNAANGVEQFISYEGTLTATNGPANGMLSTDIGVSEAGTEPAGESLQMTGSIDANPTYSDFTWTGPSLATPGVVNFTTTIPEPAAGIIVLTCVSAALSRRRDITRSSGSTA